MSNNKKVLLVSRCAWTLVTFRSGLIGFLQDRGFEVHVAGWGGDGYADRLRKMGATFHEIPVSLAPISPLRDLWLIWKLVRLYNAISPSIVHHFTIKPVILGSIAARIGGHRIVINTITGLGYVFTGSRPFLKSIIKVMYRFSLKKASIVFFQNADDQNLFDDLEIISKLKTRVVPGSGVNIDYFNPKHRVNVSKKQVNVLFIGRLLKDKGIREYIGAAELLHEQGVAATFHAIGDFDSRNPSCVSENTLKKAISDGYVTWHGKSDDVRHFLSTADIVVLPSYREGVPRALLEAAACGIPLIATDVTGCRSIVSNGHNGYLVKPKDTADLAKAISSLVENPKLREEMGKKGREKVLAEFDEAIVFEETWRAYQECLKSGQL